MLVRSDAQPLSDETETNPDDGIVEAIRRAGCTETNLSGSAFETAPATLTGSGVTGRRIRDRRKQRITLLFRRATRKTSGRKSG